MINRNHKWKLSEQSIFLLRLSDLLGKGYTLSTALEFLQFHFRPPLKRDLQKCLIKLKSGHSLHEVLRDLHFHNHVLGYLFFAEYRGELSFSLKEAGRMMMEKTKQKQKLKKVIQYPLFLLVFLGIVMIIMSQILLPQFTSLQGSIEDNENSFSSTFLSVLAYLPILMILALVFLVILCLFYALWFRKRSPLFKMRFLFYLPFLRSYLRTFNAYFFSFHMSNLLRGGLSVYESLSLFEKQSHFPFFQLEAHDLMRKLSEGYSLEETFQRRKYYQKELTYIISHGQKNGNLGQELSDYSELLLQTLHARIMKVLGYIQPFMFSAIGILVLLMYLSIMLPIFNTMSSL
ncbi:competence type IV pilus assembly protein ComGB [Priestia koreensis]|uniref:Type II secretion system protein GspF domain-containing protein n=1 Tax=Priestia koreensis TaxID=284581 RepID=A0A0M0KYN0_9BACI|nr:competence type IV pilus assembly protein ComGB [Priestia koreensis]KOO43935.1 hypothetical protein AMD01_14500 [Priestia koreensis]